jgi:hypothetical protein
LINDIAATKQKQDGAKFLLKTFVTALPNRMIPKAAAALLCVDEISILPKMYARFLPVVCNVQFCSLF